MTLIYTKGKGKILLQSILWQRFFRVWTTRENQRNRSEINLASWKRTFFLIQNIFSFLKIHYKPRHFSRLIHCQMLIWFFCVWEKKKKWHLELRFYKKMMLSHKMISNINRALYFLIYRWPLKRIVVIISQYSFIY